MQFLHGSTNRNLRRMKMDYPILMNRVRNKIPAYRTPELVSSKISILERKPPSFKINSRVVNPVEIKRANNFQCEELADVNKSNKLNQVLKLQEKLKNLEKQLTQKDKEIESLQKQTQSIVKERDAWSRKLKEYKEQREQYYDNNEEFDYFRRALTDVLNNAQDEGDSAEGDDDEHREIEEDQDNDQENEDENENNDDPKDYRSMLLAMANHMLSEKMEKRTVGGSY